MSTECPLLVPVINIFLNKADVCEFKVRILSLKLYVAVSEISAQRKNYGPCDSSGSVNK